VPGGLRRGRKIGVFVPHLRDMSAGSGGFAGITRRKGARFGRERGEICKKSNRTASAGRRGLPPTVKPANPPDSPCLAAPVPRNGR
jgi:hypothetical protein